MKKLKSREQKKFSTFSFLKSREEKIPIECIDFVYVLEYLC